MYVCINTLTQMYEDWVNTIPHISMEIAVYNSQTKNKHVIFGYEDKNGEYHEYFCAEIDEIIAGLQALKSDKNFTIN